MNAVIYEMVFISASPDVPCDAAIKIKRSKYDMRGIEKIRGACKSSKRNQMFLADVLGSKRLCSIEVPVVGSVDTFSQFWRSAVGKLANRAVDITINFNVSRSWRMK